MKKLLPIVALTLMMGCATFQTTAGKTLVSIAATVDTAMKGWAAYVVAGASTDAQQLQVRDAYGKYQIAMSAAQVAYVAAIGTPTDQSAWIAACNALTASQSSLIQLVQTFQTQPKK